MGLILGSFRVMVRDWVWFRVKVIVRISVTFRFSIRVLSWVLC